MELEIESKETGKINKTSILPQTAYWSQVKRKQGIGSKAFNIRVRASDIYLNSSRNRVITDDLLVLMQEVGDGYKIGYVPYGPALEPSERNRGAFLEELSETMRPSLPRECFLLRYDLLWESPWTHEPCLYDDKGHWKGPPGKGTQEIRMNFDTHYHKLRKANTNILPSDTIFIDLKKDEKQLIREMRPKTRYNTRLAFRRGVTVRRGGAGDLALWNDLYSETCRRNRIFFRDDGYFRDVLQTDAGDTRSPAEAELLIAELDGIPLAAMFLAFSGERATYLYGASSGRRRNCMATYALQWEAICRSKERRCTTYDMFGVAPRPDPSHPMYGLYRFKRGFGGNLFHRMGCWDYPLDEEIFTRYVPAEITAQGYHVG